MQGDPRGSVDLGHDHHAALVTCWAAVDVDASKPKKLLGNAFLDERLGLGGGGREQLTTARDLLLPSPIGEQSVVTDPYEAPGQDMEQKAANELQDIEVHDTCLLASAESR